MKLAISALATIALLAVAAPAQAKRSCAYPEATLTTSGIQCGYATDMIDNLFSTTQANRTPVGMTRHFRIRGVVGYDVEATHHFDCTVRYGAARRNVIVRCHDFGGFPRGHVSALRLTLYAEPV